MPITLQESVRNAQVDLVADDFDGGTITFLAGATVLAELTLSASVFPPASSGSTTATTSEDPTLGVQVVASGPVTGAGTCDGFTVKNSVGSVILSGDVSLVGGGASFEMTDLQFAVGDVVAISTMIYSQPATGA